MIFIVSDTDDYWEYQEYISMKIEAMELDIIKQRNYLYMMINNIILIHCGKESQVKKY